MEGGLLRDIFTHKIVTREHWDELMRTPFSAREKLEYDRWADPNIVVAPTYDPHCSNNHISQGCKPVEVISTDKLVDYTEGPAETTRVANALLLDPRMGDNIIDQQAWGCIWDELIQHKESPKTMYDRPGKNIFVLIDCPHQ